MKSPLMQLIQTCITSGLVIMGITALVAGLCVKAPHLFVIGFFSMIIAKFINEPIKD